MPFSRYFVTPPPGGGNKKPTARGAVGSFIRAFPTLGYWQNAKDPGY